MPVVGHEIERMQKAVRREVLVQVVETFVHGLVVKHESVVNAVSALDGGHGAEQLEGEHVVQVVEKAEVLLIGLAVVPEDVCFVVVKVHGVGRGRRAEQPVVAQALHGPFQGPLQHLEMLKRLRTVLQVGLRQVLVQQPLGSHEHHAAYLVQRSQREVVQQLLRISPKAHVFGCLLTYVHVLEVKVVEGFRQMLFQQLQAIHCHSADLGSTSQGIGVLAEANLGHSQLTRA